MSDARLVFCDGKIQSGRGEVETRPSGDFNLESLEAYIGPPHQAIVSELKITVQTSGYCRQESPRYNSVYATGCLMRFGSVDIGAFAEKEVIQ